MLAKKFKMTDLNEISHYLNMEIEVDKEKTTIHQTVYLHKTLNIFDLKNCKSCKISMNSDTANNIMSSMEQADKETIK